MFHTVSRAYCLCYHCAHSRTSITHADGMRLLWLELRRSATVATAHIYLTPIVRHCAQGSIILML